MQTKFIFTGLFFILILASGFWLSRTGRPLNGLILTIHKLIALGAGIYLGVMVYRLNQVAALSPSEILISAATLVFFLLMVTSGGWLSAAKEFPVVILKVHQFAPYLVILSTVAMLYLLSIQKPLPIS